MSVDQFPFPAVNWPLFLLTSFILSIRSSIPSLCLWFINKYYSPSLVIEQLTRELKEVNEELKGISPQDEFAAYTRKERQRNKLVERLKTEKSTIETKQKTLSTSIRLILNILTVLILIYLTFTGQRHQTIPLFNLPFFRFPFLLWIMAFNTFLTTLTDIYSRYQNRTD